MPKYKIVWDPEAEQQLVETWLYMADTSVKYANQLTDKIDKSVRRLVTDPYLGQEEEYLKNYTVGFRYLVCSHYKIIYRVFEDEILIATLFDTRQKPSRLKEKVKGK